MRLPRAEARASTEASRGTGGAAAVLENEKQLWDLMRPDASQERREPRREELTAIVKTLLLDYPQLLVIPLVAAATWAFLTLQ
jgi:hypothetical protein